MDKLSRWGLCLEYIMRLLFRVVNIFWIFFSFIKHNIIPWLNIIQFNLIQPRLIHLHIIKIWLPLKQPIKRHRRSLMRKLMQLMNLTCHIKQHLSFQVINKIFCNHLCQFIQLIIEHNVMILLLYLLHLLLPLLRC